MYFFNDVIYINHNHLLWSKHMTIKKLIYWKIKNFTSFSISITAKWILAPLKILTVWPFSKYYPAISPFGLFILSKDPRTNTESSKCFDFLYITPFYLSPMMKFLFFFDPSNFA
jgi:hypothetical protein